MTKWILKNKEWLFSGILVYILGTLSTEVRKHIPLLGTTFAIPLWHLLALSAVIISIVSIIFIRKMRQLLTKNIELQSMLAEASPEEPLAEIDPLTGLSNLRRLNRFFSRDLPLLQANNEDVWGIMLDIDDFRSVTGSLSIIEASDLLEQVGSRWKGRDEDDIILRWGGDEFLAIASGCTQDSAVGFARRLQKKLAESPLYVGDQNHCIRLTASAGITKWNTKSDTDRIFQERIGKALNQAKKTNTPIVVL
jgi:diguanylate cyclase (GGDEF)-like protein